MEYRITEQWLSTTPQAEREKLKQEIINSTNVLDKLDEMLYNIEVGKRETVLGDYDSASWSHKQAHLNGELAMLKKIRSLIKITEREDHSTR